MSTQTDTKSHRISWYVWAWNSNGDVAKLRHTSKMRGTWGWDAECSCGWATKTGGATRRSVEQEVWWHKHIDVDGPGLEMFATKYLRENGAGE